jgi:hypothetical protein
MEKRAMLWFRLFYGLFSSIGQTFSLIRHIGVGWAKLTAFSIAKDIFFERD